MDTIAIPVLRITQKVKITANHKLFLSNESVNRNIARFGGAFDSHSHNYTFKITFKSNQPLLHGLIDTSELIEDCVNLAIVETLNGKNLDIDISWFKTRTSSLENIVLFVWRNISIITKPHPFELEEIKVKIQGTCTKSIPLNISSSTEIIYRGESAIVA